MFTKSEKIKLYLYLALLVFVLLFGAVTYNHLQNRPETPPPGTFFINVETGEYGIAE